MGVMIEIEVKTAKNELESLILTIQKKYNGKELPEKVKMLLNVLKMQRKAYFYIDELEADLKISRRSCLKHSLDLAKMTALNGKAINKLHQAEKKIKNLEAECFG